MAIFITSIFYYKVVKIAIKNEVLIINISIKNEIEIDSI